MANPIKQTIVQRKNDPFLYLYVMGEWYCYNPKEAPLGSGAMGDVYCGYRCKTGEQIAVKRVKDVYANIKMIRERARQEASLAFRHPNLVEMIGYCEYAPDYGPIFILSNFVNGVNIDKYIKSFSLSPNRVEKICKAMCSVLDALDYIHSRKVIHRDVKPSNIMVENGSNVRLMDLGISRMTSGNSYSQNGFIGTPQYSAPEQIKRDEGDNSVVINASTDIYELGITMYELLAGNNPMDCDSDVDTLTKQLTERLPYDSAIPKRLMNVLWKATEKEQSKRYQTAMQFKRAIEESLITPPSFWERIKTGIDDNFVAIVSSIVVIAIILFVIILLVM